MIRSSALGGGPKRCTLIFTDADWISAATLVAKISHENDSFQDNGLDPSKGSLDDHVDWFGAAVLNRAAAKTNLTDTKQYIFHLGSINARQSQPEKVWIC